ncbi:kinetochore-associated protein DSN1 homolog [Ambystoma mexicanum]|uniref:kinetochore-associated protein DSN1 homolog n=1 Tax=Ambystoma mexicanum TaxID=8296 RepID=UPI0037E76BEC
MSSFQAASDLIIEKMEMSCSSFQSGNGSGKTDSVRRSPRDKGRSNQEKRSYASSASKVRDCSGPSPKRISPLKPSPKKRCSPSPVPHSFSPNRRRRSWRRSSMKGNNARKSLPPMRCDRSALSKSISLDLPETERLSRLLQSCFQLSVQKLEDSLKLTDGFNLQAFKAKALSITRELNHFTERLERDGTLHRCTKEPNSNPPDPALEDAKAQIRDYIERFTKECHSWDNLLLSYQKTEMERSRLLEEIRSKKVQETLPTPHRTSQDKVLKSKPDYQKILRDQSEVFDYMELVIGELQQAVTVLHSFMDENSKYLKSISAQLELRSFQQIEDSPMRRFLKVSRNAHRQ